MRQKLKSFIQNDQYFYGFLVILVGIVSFLLGQKSTPLGANKPQEVVTFAETSQKVSIDKTKVTLEDNTKTSVSEGVIASKNGTKYHLESCPGASQIKEENRIIFASVAEAKAAGYTPAANCPGLQ